VLEVCGSGHLLTHQLFVSRSAETSVSDGPLTQFLNEETTDPMEHTHTHTHGSFRSSGEFKEHGSPAESQTSSNVSPIVG